MIYEVQLLSREVVVRMLIQFCLLECKTLIRKAEAYQYTVLRDNGSQRRVTGHSLLASNQTICLAIIYTSSWAFWRPRNQEPRWVASLNLLELDGRKSKSCYAYINESRHDRWDDFVVNPFSRTYTLDIPKDVLKCCDQAGGFDASHEHRMAHCLEVYSPHMLNLLYVGFSVCRVFIHPHRWLVGARKDSLLVRGWCHFTELRVYQGYQYSLGWGLDLTRVRPRTYDTVKTIPELEEGT